VHLPVTVLGQHIRSVDKHKLNAFLPGGAAKRYKGHWLRVGIEDQGTVIHDTPFFVAGYLVLIGTKKPGDLASAGLFL
jgi:hypothetical protein